MKKIDRPKIDRPTTDLPSKAAASSTGQGTGQSTGQSTGQNAPAQTTAQTTPAAAPAIRPAAPAPAASAKSAPAAVSGGTSVQIGAYDSTDSASAEYAKVASSYGLFVGGAGKKIEKVTTPKGVFYRTAFTGLTPDKARAFCAALKANGRDCIIR